MKRPKRAIVRPPGQSYCECISSHPDRFRISLRKAIAQHMSYTETLSDLGIEIICLPHQDDMPDSCFVEDTAIITDELAIITRPLNEARRRETQTVKDKLSEFLRVIEIQEPAIIEGGDVIVMENKVICGITQRTNQAGASHLAEFLNREIITIEDKSIMHLKSHITRLSESMLITTNKYASHPSLDEFELLIVDDDELYAANTLSFKEFVLIPSRHPKTKKMIHELGFKVIEMDISEFRKCDAALTCLSLIF